jgi:hypothetical protein
MNAERARRMDPNEDEERDDDEEEEEDGDDGLRLQDEAPPPVVAPPRGRGRPPKPVAIKPSQLEDLYDKYPTIGDGVTFLRVYRLQPKMHMGQMIAGHIGDLHEQIQLTDFGGRYGGGRYSVQVMKPSRADGLARSVELLDNITIPGIPILPGDDSMMSNPTRGGYVPPQSAQHPSVEIERMKLEDKRDARQYEDTKKREADQSRTGPEVMRLLKDLGDGRVQDAKEQGDKTNQILREQNARLIEDYAVVKKLNTELNAEVLDAKKAELDATKSATQETELRLRVVHEAAIKSLQERHQAEVSALREQFRRDQEQAETRARERFDDLRLRSDENYRRLETESRTERDRLIRDSDRSEKSLKDSYEARIHDLTLATSREISSVRETRDRELSTVKASHDTNEKYSKQAMDLQITTMQNEINRIRTEGEALRRENEVLRKAQNKDPRQFILETREMAGVLGMVDAADAKGEEEGNDWKSMGMKVLAGLAPKLPEFATAVAGGIAATREQNRQLAQQPQQGAPGQNRAVPPQQRRRGVPPPVFTGGSIAPLAQEIPFNPPIPPRITIVQQQPAQEGAVVSPPPVQEPVAAVLEPQHGLPMEAQANPQSPQTEPPADAPEFLYFVEQLNNAIQGGTPADEFAKNFYSIAGKEQAKQLLDMIPHETFVEHCESRNIGPNIATRHGRVYVKSVWSVVQSLVSAAA